MNLQQYRVIVLPTAFNDLDAIADSIYRDSPQNAVEMLDRLWQAAQSLATLPHRYKTYRWNTRPDRVIRSMPVVPYVIYYRGVDSPPHVRVLTVRHGARRQPRHFETVNSFNRIKVVRSESELAIAGRTNGARINVRMQTGVGSH